MIVSDIFCPSDSLVSSREGLGGTSVAMIVSSTPICLKTEKILGKIEICLMATASLRPGKFLFLSSISVNQVTKFSVSFVFRRCVRKMEGLEISEMRVEPCVDSRFIRPSRVVFKQVSLYIESF